jgi:hypothetical protein
MAPSTSVGDAQTVCSNGRDNGRGYGHINRGNGPGDPNRGCLQGVASSEGLFPFNSAAPRAARFNEMNDQARGQYARSLAQNSRNTASAAQYDSA